MQVAVTTLVDVVTDKVGSYFVRVTKVRVFVVVTGSGVTVTVGLSVAEGLVTNTGGSTVVLVKVLVEVASGNDQQRKLSQGCLDTD